jgi:uncharacterized membrane protein
MRAHNAPERLVAFTDAVVAIAITLLVLPLVDVVPAVVSRREESVQVITDHTQQIFSFVLSFAVIARLWLVHHRFFAQVRSHTPALVLWNLCWLLTIVVLPFPTEMVGAFGNDRFTVAFYVGTILASSMCQTIMVLIARREPELVEARTGIMDQQAIAAVAASASLTLALLLVLLVPAVGYYALLLLFLAPLLSRIGRRIGHIG